MKQELNKKVEKTLSSLDGIHQAEVRPFFYTRLQGRLVREQQSEQLQQKLAWATLVIVLLANALVYALYKSEEQVNTDDMIVQMSEEYNIYQQDLFGDITE